MMFKFGNVVRHKAASITGKVIGYGKRQVTNGYYITTLKVELRSEYPIAPIAEDAVERWEMYRSKKRAVCNLSYLPQRIRDKSAVA